MYAAASSGHTNVVDYLVKAGANINAQDDEDKTALITAVIYGHTEVVGATFMKKDCLFHKFQFLTRFSDFVK